jgi:hypothetical protein
MKVSVPKNIIEKYKTPSSLTDFQLKMYIHLIEWKWKHITTDWGEHNKEKYGAILPEEYKREYYPLYQPLVKDLSNHNFKLHKHFGHMASSQAACLNLFLSILRDKKTADNILPQINSKYKELATDELEGGFQFEYCDPANPLNDHTVAAGTDADVAIAYYDTLGSLSLWLIEHKLTENEFTTCGGYKSRGNKAKGNCDNGQLILNDHSKCYYNYHCEYKYWELSDESGIYNLQSLKNRSKCPFIGGENQLWRNQLLGYAIKKKGQFKNVHFSVVHHTDNYDLADTIERYKKLLNENDSFKSYTLRDFVTASRKVMDEDFTDWLSWYRELYMV